MLDGSPIHKVMDVLYNFRANRHGGQLGYHSRGKGIDGSESGLPETARGPSWPSSHAWLELAHQDIDTGTVCRSLYNQVQMKAPGPDVINFNALKLLWEYVSRRVTVLIRQCIKLGFHPHAWKTAKGVMLQKPNRINYTLVKSYQVITLLYCLGKVCKKVAAEILAYWCEVHHILHESQRELRRQQSAIDAVALAT